MNIIAIDPSLSCTAVVVNDKKFIYASESTVNTKKGNMKEWFEVTSELLTARIHQDLPTNLDHVDLEAYKLVHFRHIAYSIAFDVMNEMEKDVPTILGIEGYSYSSAAGPLIDLVTLGTMIRLYVTNLAPSITFQVFPPTTLKQKAAQLTYLPKATNKAETKFEWRNNEGVAGGSFKKHEIYKALTDNQNLNCEWVNFLRGTQDVIMAAKSVPKPIEDMNDAKMLYEIMKASTLENK